jgi:hypothetical protein
VRQKTERREKSEKYFPSDVMVMRDFLLNMRENEKYLSYVKISIVRDEKFMDLIIIACNYGISSNLVLAPSIGEH